MPPEDPTTSSKPQRPPFEETISSSSIPSSTPTATAVPAAAANRTKKARVSFSSEKPSIEGIDPPPSPVASTSSGVALPSLSEAGSDLLMARTPSKSALKPGIGKDTVPPELHSHPDPLLRRLRLRDRLGNEVNLKREFRDCKVVGFLFGASWTKHEASFYQDVMEFTRGHPHRFKCIYVSIDTDEASYKANTENKPWLSMEWNDGSNLPVSAHEDSVTPIVLSRSEDFLLASEPDVEADLVADDPTGSIYVRPYARVHLAAKLTVLKVPTLMVYNLETRKWLSYNVGKNLLDQKNWESTWEKWERGEKTDFDLSLRETFWKMRWTVALLIFAIIYHLSVRFGGAEYNFLANFVTDMVDRFGLDKSR